MCRIVASCKLPGGRWRAVVVGSVTLGGPACLHPAQTLSTPPATSPILTKCLVHLEFPIISRWPALLDQRTLVVPHNRTSLI